ncbi:MAG TPA: squalene synthase HpnC [Solibacterales bacterium]|nr:squalene synthase HpnC [Bryobacterales bacterium]
MGVDHYENFPVASWLCPPAWRPAVAAIYHFARTADDIADEGVARPAQRIAQLDDFEAALRDAADGRVDGAWPEVFGPLARQMRAHDLPLAPFIDLLSAFRQDTGNPLYPDRAALLDYCARSANPIGRLLLRLAHVDEREAQARSDAICSALQLINFWQDVRIDYETKNRIYLPRDEMRRFGVGEEHLRDHRCDAAFGELMRFQVERARRLMLAGAPLARALPGRPGMEIALTVQGGLRILEKLERAGYDMFRRRPVLGPLDWPVLLFRSFLANESKNSQ